MKGGKGGRGRKSSNARFHGKSTARGAKKSVAKRDGGAAARKSAKKTTKLGAHRVPDDD